MNIYIPEIGIYNPYACDGDDDYKELPDKYKKFYDGFGEPRLIEWKRDKLFHVGSSKKDIAVTAHCKKCGGKEFNVGSADYWTGIKCTTCGYEVCIHEG